VIEDLIQRIQEELDQIKRAKHLAEKRWKKALSDLDYLGSVALDLLN
jgi:ubiquinone biosynthesis protein Coq4